MSWLPWKKRFRSHRRVAPVADARIADTRVDDVLRSLNDNQPTKAPDVSRAVLSRLGYSTVSAPVARRTRIALWMRRVGSTGVVVGMLCVSVWAVHHSRMQHAHRGAIEDVVRASLEQKRAWLGDVAEGLSPLSKFPAAISVPARFAPAGAPAGSEARPYSDANETPKGDEQPAEAPFRKA